MGGEIVASRQEEMVKGQAERLFPMLEEVLSEAEVGWSALDIVGVGTGPGNFTGNRIAVSAARGLAISLVIPAIGISRFEAHAFGTTGVVISSVAGPRGQVYARVMNHEGADPVLGMAENISLDAPARAEPVCIGADAEVFARRFSGHVAKAKFPLTEAIGRIAASRKDNSQIPRPTPLYIRPADALPSSDPPPVILP